MPPADLVATLKLTVVSSQTFATCLRTVLPAPAPLPPGPLSDTENGGGLGDSPPESPGNTPLLARNSTHAAPTKARVVDGTWPLHPCAGRALTHVMRAATASSTGDSCEFDPQHRVPPPESHADLNTDAAVASLVDSCRSKLASAVAANRDVLIAAAAPDDDFTLPASSETMAASTAPAAVEFAQDDGTAVMDVSTLVALCGGPGVAGARTVPTFATLQPHITAAREQQQRLRSRGDALEDFTDSDGTDTPQTMEIGSRGSRSPAPSRLTSLGPPQVSSAQPKSSSASSASSDFDVEDDDGDSGPNDGGGDAALRQPVPCSTVVLVRPLVAFGNDESLGQSAAAVSNTAGGSMLMRAGSLVRGAKPTPAAFARRGSMARPAGEFASILPFADMSSWAPWRRNFPHLPLETRALRQLRSASVYTRFRSSAPFEVDASVALAVAEREQQHAAELPPTSASHHRRAKSTTAARSSGTPARPASAATACSTRPSSAATVETQHGETPASESSPCDDVAIGQPAVIALGPQGTGVASAVEAIRSVAVQCLSWEDIPVEGWGYTRRVVVCASSSVHFASMRPCCLEYAIASPLDGVHGSFEPDSGYRLCPALGSAGLHVGVQEAPKVQLTVPVTFRAPWFWVSPSRRVAAFECGSERSDGALLQLKDIACHMPLALYQTQSGPGTPPRSPQVNHGHASFADMPDTLTVSVGGDASATPRSAALSPHAGQKTLAPPGARRRRRSSAGVHGLFGPPPPLPMQPLDGWRLVIDIGPREAADAAAGGAAVNARTCVGFLSIPPMSVLSRGRGAGQPKRQTIYVGGLAVADVVEGYAQPVVPPASSLASADFRRGDDAVATNRVVIEFLVPGSNDGSSTTAAWRDILNALRGNKERGAARRTAATRPASSNASSRHPTARAAADSKSADTPASPMVTISGEIEPNDFGETSDVFTLGSGPQQGLTPSANDHAIDATNGSNDHVLDGGDVPRQAAAMLVKAVASRLRFWAPDPYEDLLIESAMAVAPEDKTRPSSDADALPRAIAPALHDAAVSLVDPFGTKSSVAVAAFTFRREDAPEIVFARSGEENGMASESDTLNRDDHSVRRIELPLRLPPAPSVLHAPSLPRLPSVLQVRPFEGVRVQLPNAADLDNTAVACVHRGGALFVTAHGSASSREGLAVASLDPWMWNSKPTRKLRVVSTTSFGQVPAEVKPASGNSSSSPNLVAASEDFGLFLPPPLAGYGAGAAGAANTMGQSAIGAVFTSPAAPAASSPSVPVHGSPACLRVPSISTAGHTSLSTFETSGCVVNSLGVPVAIYRLPPGEMTVELRFRCVPYDGPLPEPLSFDELDHSTDAIEAAAAAPQPDAGASSSVYTHDHRSHGLPDAALMADVLRLIRFRVVAANVTDGALSREDRTLRIRLCRGNAELLRLAADEPSFRLQLSSQSPGRDGTSTGATMSQAPRCRPLLWSDFGHFVASLTWALPVVQPTTVAHDIGYAEMVEGSAPVRVCSTLLEPHKTVQDTVSVAQLDAFAVAFAGNSARRAAVRAPYVHDHLSVKRVDELNFVKVTSPAVTEFLGSDGFRRRLHCMAESLDRTACGAAAAELTAIARRTTPLLTSEAKEVTVSNTPVGVCLTLNAVVAIVLIPAIIASGADGGLRRKDLVNVLKAFYLARVAASSASAAAVASVNAVALAASQHKIEPKSGSNTPHNLSLLMHQGNGGGFGGTGGPVAALDDPSPSVGLHVYVFGASGAPEPTVASLSVETTHAPDAAPLLLASTPLTSLGTAAPAAPSASAAVPPPPHAGGPLVWRRQSSSWASLVGGGVPLFTPGDSLLAVGVPVAAGTAVPATSLGASSLTPDAASPAAAAAAAVVRQASAGVALDISLEGASCPPLPPAAGLHPSDRHGLLSLSFVPPVAQNDHLRALFSSSRPGRAYRRPGSLSEHDAQVASHVRIALVPTVSGSGDGLHDRVSGGVATFDIVATVSCDAGDANVLPCVTAPETPAAAHHHGKRPSKKDATRRTSGIAEQPVTSLDRDAWGALAGQTFTIGTFTAFEMAADAALDRRSTHGHRGSNTSHAAHSIGGAAASIGGVGDVSGGSTPRSGSGVIIPILESSPRPDDAADGAPPPVATTDLEATLRPSSASQRAVTESGPAFPVRRVLVKIGTVAAPCSPVANEKPAAGEADPPRAASVDVSAASRALLSHDGFAMLRLILGCTVVTTTSPPAAVANEEGGPRAMQEPESKASPRGAAVGPASRLATPTDTAAVGVSSAAASRPASSKVAGIAAPLWTSGTGTLPPRIVVRTTAPTVSAMTDDTSAAETEDQLTTDRHPREAVRSKAVFPLDTAMDVGVLAPVAPPAVTRGDDSDDDDAALQAAADEATRRAVSAVGRALIAPASLRLRPGVISPALSEGLSLLTSGLIGSSDMALGLRIELSVVALPGTTLPMAYKDGTVHRPFTWARVPLAVARVAGDGTMPACHVISAASTFDNPQAQQGPSQPSYRLIFGFSALERSSYSIRDGNLAAGSQFIASVNGPHNWSKNPAHALLPIPAHPGPATLSVTFGPQHKTARGKHLADLWKGFTIGLMPAEKAGGAKGGRFGMVLAAAMAKTKKEMQQQQGGAAASVSSEQEAPATPTTPTPPTEAGDAAATNGDDTRPGSASKPPVSSRPSSAPKTSAAARTTHPVAPRLAVRVIVEDAGVDPLVAFVPIVFVWPAAAAAVATPVTPSAQAAGATPTSRAGASPKE